MTYDALRAQRIESGALYADYVMKKLSSDVGWHIQVYNSRHYQFTEGEGPSCVEVKNDTIFAKSRHLWIEIAEKARPRSGGFAPSGIYRADNTVLYAIGDFDTIFIFDRKILRGLHTLQRYPVRENKTHTSQGFRLPAADALATCITRLTPNAEQKVLRVSRRMQELDRQLLRAALADPNQPSLPLSSAAALEIANAEEVAFLTAPEVDLVEVRGRR